MKETANPVDGTPIAFDVYGEGPPLLLVHGSALSRSIWRGFGYVAALQSQYRVIALDLRGHGRSGKPREPDAYRMPLVLGDILAVLDAVDAPAAHYFGYSFGARAGFSLADEHPERMLSLISAGGTYRAPRVLPRGRGRAGNPGFPARVARNPDAAVGWHSRPQSIPRLRVGGYPHAECRLLASCRSGAWQHSSARRAGARSGPAVSRLGARLTAAVMLRRADGCRSRQWRRALRSGRSSGPVHFP
jgi:pimeloyl-ACP methyl ester carboxylesterase